MPRVERGAPLSSVPMTDPAEAPRTALLVGTRVEVRTGFDDSWSAGFVVDEVVDDGYRIRRRSDRQVLPTTFAPATVRRERKSSMWWV